MRKVVGEALALAAEEGELDDEADVQEGDAPAAAAAASSDTVKDVAVDAEDAAAMAA